MLQRSSLVKIQVGNKRFLVTTEKSHQIRKSITLRGQVTLLE